MISTKSARLKFSETMPPAVLGGGNILRSGGIGVGAGVGIP
jgi:hypothetical protein